MHRFIVPRTSPKSATSRSSRGERPLIEGRQIASRMAAAKSERSSDVPAAPISSKIVPAIAAPNCSEAMATMTRSRSCSGLEPVPGPKQP
jgi:hypothetical protein